MTIDPRGLTAATDTEGRTLAQLVSPTSLSTYLGTEGWNLTDRLRGGDIWSLGSDNDPEASVLVPTATQFADYSRRLSETLDTLCELYDWDVPRLLASIAAVRSDLVLVRADQFMRDETIPVLQAQSLLAGAVQMFTAAARATIDKRPSYGGGRKPDQVTKFVDDDLRMGHTRRGSFIITLLTRLDEEVPPAESNPSEVLNESFDNEPRHDSKGAPLPRLAAGPPFPVGKGAGDEVGIPSFQRRVVSTLATSLRHVQSISANASNANLERAVASGVNVELCNALHDMTQYEGLRSLDISFKWSSVESVPADRINEVVMGRDAMPGLQTLSGRLKRQNVPIKSTVFGKVVKLERSDDSTSDEHAIVTVEGIEGKNTRRKVKIDLSGAAHDAAIAAYKSKGPVTVTGQREKVGSSFWMRGRVDFEVM